ncbi:MAG: hypothetical protein ACREO2_08795, partial [Arenimonas sp.]
MSATVDPTSETATSKAFKERNVAAVLTSLLPFLKPYWFRICLALLCLVIAKLANLGSPILMKNIVDQMNVDPNLLMLPV